MEHIKRYAFTLAEVLITLGIIGIIASMVLPALINNIQDMQYKTAYKKAYSIASQALISADQSDLVNINTDSFRDATNFKVFMNQFNVIKSCTTNNNGECWDSTGELFGRDYSDGLPDRFYYAFIDKSGMAWTLISGNEGRIAVDTNGFKKPNRWGKDRFVFVFVDINSVPVGLPAKIRPWKDSPNAVNVCPQNMCGTTNDYYGISWLYK